MPATADSLWHLLEQVPDPEIPALSIVDLGIVREVAVDADGACRIAITPTYSGCPAMRVIAEDVRRVLAAHGVGRVEVETRLAPAWTTDWMSDAARGKLRDHGIAPPGRQAGGARPVDIGALVHGADNPVPCPRCGSEHTRLLSRFGSTGCKALYACQDCREPFDHFKAH
jgi:ring-1,2-phenylacetyl-CoA epoxidase subunit PaaD